MTSLLRSMLQTSGVIQRQLSMDQYIEFMQYNALNYPLAMMTQTMSGHEERAVDVSFPGLTRSGFKGNGTVFSCMIIRQKLFSEARFQFRRRENGRPGKLFGGSALASLEKPWIGGTTGDLLARAIQDADLAGNFFCTPRVVQIRGRSFRTIKRMRPDWVVIILGSYDDPDVEAGDLDAEVVGYIYLPGGPGSGREPVFLLPEFVSHFAPIPDPEASYRGMPWLMPIVREYLADTAMIAHKNKFLERGATPNLVVTLDPSIKKEAFKEWVQMFSDKHEGYLNAYKTLYLGAGASILPVGKDFQQMEFAVTQAVGELRICSASGVPPVLVGVTEGIKAATYSNYQSAKRFFADGTLRPLWRNFASSIENIIDVPENAELWYDDRDIPFLYDDAKDAATIQQRHAATISSLVSAGYTPDSVVQAVIADDFELLKHTGLFSVQLLPPGTQPGTQPGGKGASPSTPAPSDPGTGKPKPSTSPSQTPTKSNGSGGGVSRVEALELMQNMAIMRQALAPQEPPTVDVHFHEGAFRSEAPTVNVDARTQIEEGAVRVEAPQVTVPVEVHPAEVVIEEGAIRVETPVTVEPTFELVEGAIQVHSPVTIEEGAVKVESASQPEAPQRSVRRVIERDERGLISSVTEEEVEVDE